MKAIATVLTMLAAMLLVGCAEEEPSAERTGQEIGRQVDDAAQEIKEGAEDAKDEIEDALNN